MSMIVGVSRETGNTKASLLTLLTHAYTVNAAAQRYERFTAVTGYEKQSADFAE